jgi:hypothetical protein
MKLGYRLGMLAAFAGISYYLYKNKSSSPNTAVDSLEKNIDTLEKQKSVAAEINRLELADAVAIGFGLPPEDLSVTPDVLASVYVSTKPGDPLRIEKINTLHGYGYTQTANYFTT